MTIFQSGHVPPSTRPCRFWMIQSRQTLAVSLVGEGNGHILFVGRARSLNLPLPRGPPGASIKPRGEMQALPGPPAPWQGTPPTALPGSPPPLGSHPIRKHPGF